MMATHLAVVASASATDILGVLASCMGILIGGSPLLQMMRTERRQSSDDVSVPFIGILFVGQATWVCYGVALGNAPPIIGNSVGVIASGATLLSAVRWRRMDDPAMDRDSPPRA